MNNLMTHLSFSSKHWFGKYLLSLLLGGIAFGLYYFFGTVLPIVGHLGVQVLWFLVFFIAGIISLFKTKQKLWQKIPIFFLLLIIAIPLQFFNFLGAFFMLNPPSYVSKCSDYPIYYKSYFSGDGPMSVELYKSTLPILYYQPIRSSTGQKFGTDSSIEIKLSDFRSQAEFNKFTGCLNLFSNKDNYLLKCDNFYFGTRYDDQKFQDMKQKCS